MKHLKIIYYANHGNTGSDDTEGHITRALEKLGHTVIKVSDKMIDIPDGDVLLFHKGGAGLKDRLINFKGKTVCWYFDKVWEQRIEWIRDMVKRVDYMFVTDGDWAEKIERNNVFVLRQGVGESNAIMGKPSIYTAKIAFTGMDYSYRTVWVDKLKKRYGGQFRVYGSHFNKDLVDLCASVPIFTAPEFPSTDKYWSSRVYMTLGSGGFLIHPRLKELENEYKDGKEIVFYDNEEDMFDKIDYYLLHKDEREKIRRAGFKKTLDNYTYTHRLKELIKILNERLPDQRILG